MKFASWPEISDRSNLGNHPARPAQWALEGFAMEKGNKDAAVHLFANFQFSLTGKQQADWQLFLRALPEQYQEHEIWKMLHTLTHTPSWTEAPQHGVWQSATPRFKEGDRAIVDTASGPELCTVTSTPKRRSKGLLFGGDFAYDVELDRPLTVGVSAPTKEQRVSEKNLTPVMAAKAGK